jgi:hypothetical protein
VLTSQRVIFNDNGTLTDVSAAVGDFRTGSLTPVYTTGEDYLYIGSEYPFNHKWIDVGTANAVASTVSVSIWNGSSWVAAVDVMDGTKASTASLSQDGFLRWSIDHLTATWSPEEQSTNVTGLTGTYISNFYWVRLSWNATLTAGATITYIGNKFSNDDQLFSFYPDLNNADLMTQFEAAKTDWNEQAYAASDALIRELKRRGVIFSRSQVFDYEVLNEPAIHKTAAIIYGGMGPAFTERATAAREAYGKAIDLGYFNVDKDADGVLTPEEKTETTGWLGR